MNLSRFWTVAVSQHNRRKPTQQTPHNKVQAWVQTRNLLALRLQY